MSTAMVLAAGKQSLLDGLTPLQLFLASFALLIVAGIVYYVNHAKLGGESLFAGLASLFCGLAGVIGLYHALFG